MLTRLFRPFIALDGDEISGGAEPVEAPTVDQPDTADVTPDTGTSDAEGSTPEAPEAETPEAPEAPEVDDTFTDLAAVPPELQDRAKAMQADYTRKTQALAERHAELDNAEAFITDLVADEPNETMEAVFKTLAAKLGYDLDDDDDEDEPEGTDTVDQPAEPVDERTAKLDALLAREDAKAAEEANAAFEAELDTIEAGITDGIKALAKADGIDLSEEEIDVIFDGVLALPPQDGGPATKASWDRWKVATKASWDRYINSKDSTRAPNGQQAGEPVDLSTPEGRIASNQRAIERARAGRS